MARLKQQKKRRKWVQTSVMLLTNAYIPGFFRGEIYQGKLKQICVPGLNCYSCPGALGACPMGVLQNSIADPYQQISFYVLGFLIMVGAIMGRFVWEIFPNMEAVEAKINVADPAADQVRTLIAEEVRDINHQLAPYKYIRSFTLRTTEFAKTTSKKIKRNI